MALWILPVTSATSSDVKWSSGNPAWHEWARTCNRWIATVEGKNVRGKMRVSDRILATERGRMVEFDYGVGRGELSPSTLTSSISALSGNRPFISIKISNSFR